MRQTSIIGPAPEDKVVVATVVATLSTVTSLSCESSGVGNCFVSTSRTSTPALLATTVVVCVSVAFSVASFLTVVSAAAMVAEVASGPARTRANAEVSCSV